MVSATYKETYSDKDIEVLEKRFDIYNCRSWPFYPIIMPLNEDGLGPSDFGDTAKNTWEVWDHFCNSHGSFDNLPDAINEAMRLTKEVMGGSED